MKKSLHVIASTTILILTLISLSLPVSANGEINFGQTVGVSGHSLAIKSDGSLWAWGSNLYGQVGDGATDWLGNYNKTYKTNNLIATDKMYVLFPKEIMKDVREVSAEYDYSMAIKNDGSLWAWGRNLNGILGNGKTSYYDDFGNDSNVPIKIMDDVAAVSCSRDHVLVVKTDGSLWAWGINDRGQLGDGTNLDSLVPKKIMDKVVAVSSGFGFSMAIQADGSLWSWGKNDWGILGNGNETLFEGVNNDSSIPLKIMDDVIAVSAGEEHTFAIKTDGSLWSWGHNRNGKILGNGEIEGGILTPVKIMDDVKSAKAAIYNSLVIKEDSSLWTWGYNYSGGLGNGTHNDSYIPVKIMDDVEAIGTSATGSSFMAVKKDRSLWMWGNNGDGQLGNGESGWQVHSTIPLRVLDDVAFPDVRNGSAGTVISLP